MTKRDLISDAVLYSGNFLAQIPFAYWTLLALITSRAAMMHARSVINVYYHGGYVVKILRKSTQKKKKKKKRENASGGVRRDKERGHKKWEQNEDGFAAQVFTLHEDGYAFVFLLCKSERKSLLNRLCPGRLNWGDDDALWKSMRCAERKSDKNRSVIITLRRDARRIFHR